MKALMRNVVFSSLALLIASCVSPRALDKTQLVDRQAAETGVRNAPLSVPSFCSDPYPEFAAFLLPNDVNAQKDWNDPKAKLFSSGMTLAEILKLATVNIKRCKNSINSPLAHDIGRLEKDPIFDGAYAPYSSKILNCKDFQKTNVSPEMESFPLIGREVFAISSMCKQRRKRVVELHFRSETDLYMAPEKRTEVFGAADYISENTNGALIEFLIASIDGQLEHLGPLPMPKYTGGFHGNRLALREGDNFLCQANRAMCFYLRYNDPGRMLEGKWGTSFKNLDGLYSGELEVFEFRIFVSE